VSESVTKKRSQRCAEQVHTASGLQQIDNNFVRDSHDLVLLDFIVGDESDRVIGQHGHGQLQPLYVLGRSVDQTVDVLRRSDDAVDYDREASDEDVANAFSIQCIAQRLRRPSSSGARE